REVSPLRERGADVGMALLVKFYEELPERRENEGRAAWAARLQKGLDKLKAKVAAHYTEGTLQRLLGSGHTQTRRAAVIALGLVGTFDSNEAVAAMLHDEDLAVRQLASDALWSLWYRGDTPAHYEELQRLMRLATGLGRTDGSGKEDL